VEPLEYITLSPQETAKLISAGSGDAALLYLYIKASGDTRLLHAQERLRMQTPALGWAESLLKQLGLTDTAVSRNRYEKARAPVYTGEAVAAATAQDPAFTLLQGEISRRLGRVLTTEELKTLLAIRDYLKLPPEVVSMVLTYCLQRNEYYNRTHGKDRRVTMRVLERECYSFANHGIVTLEAASEYISRNLQLLSPESQIKKVLQLDRNLVDAERTYIRTWLQWGFPPETVRLAYEKTLVATGKLAWRYLDRILQNWHEKGLHTPQEVQQGQTQTAETAPEAGQGFTMSQSELEAIADMARQRGRRKEEDHGL